MSCIIKVGGELYHHGVKGQKWGVRRYQNKDGSYVSGHEGRYYNYKKSSSGKKATSANDVIKNNSGTSLATVKNSGTKEGVVELLAANATLLLATTAISLSVDAISMKHEEKKFTKACDKELDDLYENRSISSLEEAPKLNKPMPASESMKMVNPDYPDVGTTSNCMMCTTAMVMREKGYDVKSKKSIHGYMESNFDSLFEGEGSNFKRMKKAHSVDAVIKTLNDEGDGAYGNLTLTWDVGGGHSVFWKNEGGTTHIYDGQSGEEIKTSKEDRKSDKNNYLNRISPSHTQYARLDNAQPTERVLAVLEKR